MEIGHQEALWPGCMAHSYKRIFKDRINRTEGGKEKIYWRQAIL